MNKSLLTLAIASSLAVAGAVQAETKVYGHAQVEIGSYGGDSTGMGVADASRGRIGLKNSEDLGDGLKSIANFEFKVDTADGIADTSGGSKVSLAKRTMMVGLKGGFGQVELGRLKSAYKYYGGVKYDPFVATLLEARGSFAMSGKEGQGNGFGHNGFIDDSVGYQKKMGAISFRITYDLDDGGPVAATPGTATSGNGMTLGAKFGGKKFEAGVAIADDGNDVTVDNAYSATKLFGMINMGGGGKIKLQLESTTQNTAGVGADVDYTYIDYNLKLGKSGMLDVALGTADFGGAADGTMTRVAYAHNLSKKTRLTVGYKNDDLDVGGVSGNVSVIAFGLRKKF